MEQRMVGAINTSPHRRLSLQSTVHNRIEGIETP